ncbi:MAG TPA: hypothetical protein VGD78_23445, partial [Chthoniobacterales bacterium]
ARIFKRTRDGGGGETTMVFVWQVRVAVFVVILGIAHTAQRLGGGGANFLFVAGYSDPSSLVLYGSLALLVFCVVVIAVDLWDEVTASRSRRKGDSEPSVTPV